MYVEKYIKIEDLKDGWLYKIIARNASDGIWKAKSQGFIISRFKFGNNFIFEEYHYDCEEFATAQPIEEVEQSPFNTKDLTDDVVVINGIQHAQFRNERAVLNYLNKFEGIK